MFTIYDVIELCSDESRLQKWLLDHGLLQPMDSKCAKCGSGMRDCDYRGKPGKVCGNKHCRARASGQVGSVLEQCKLTHRQFVFLVYWWAHDCAGTRAEHMLGHGSVTIADWSARFRMCVMAQQAAWGEVLGGPDVEVEADETEIGRRKKGIHGHDNAVSGDVRGVFERVSGRVVLDVYEKLHKSFDERRFGPPNCAEADALFNSIAAGSILFSDDARAYSGPAKDHGLVLRTVDHNKGIFSRREMVRGKQRVVSTNGIDGVWGRLKTCLRAKGGVPGHLIQGYIKEYQWRVNRAGKDPFLAVMEHIRDGYFQ